VATSGDFKLATDIVEIYPAKNGGLVERGGIADLRLGFRVTNIESSLIELVARGGSIVNPLSVSDGQRTAVVADPDSHRVELTEAN
jgi:predicted enzyme related to lactoylglutathione lyase